MGKQACSDLSHKDTHGGSDHLLKAPPPQTALLGFNFIIQIRKDIAWRPPQLTDNFVSAPAFKLVFDGFAILISLSHQWSSWDLPYTYHGNFSLAWQSVPVHFSPGAPALTAQTSALHPFWLLHAFQASPPWCPSACQTSFFLGPRLPFLLDCVSFWHLQIHNLLISGCKANKPCSDNSKHESTSKCSWERGIKRFWCNFEILAVFFSTMHIFHELSEVPPYL